MHLLKSNVSYYLTLH